MDSKICVVCNIEKSIDNFITNIENVNSVTLKEVQNVTMIIEIQYQINEKFLMKKIQINFYRNKMIITKKEA